jgi:nitrilase
MKGKKVAVVQVGSYLFDTPRTMEHMRYWCDQAARERAELVVFPEAFIGGYPKGMDFGARVGSRSPGGRDAFRAYWDSAIDVPGPEVQQTGKFAAEIGATLVVGVVERDHGTLHCSVLFFGPDGTLIGKHRKLQPTASERLIWGQGDGSTMQVLQTQVGRIGSAICWENYMPMLRQYMYSQGIEIWCAPTVDEREIWQASMRHLAYEGRCFVLSACHYLPLDHCSQDYLEMVATQPGVPLIRGGSVIVSPLGEVLAGPVYDQECVLSATIDLNDVIRGKYDLDVSGHYSRPEVFQLQVNLSKQLSVNALDPITHHFAQQEVLR